MIARIDCRFITVFAAFVAAGCSGAATQPIGVTGSLAIETPAVLQKDKPPVNWVQFSPGSSTSNFAGIVIGPDKNLWYADKSGKGVARINMSGGNKEFPAGSCPSQLAVGADRKFYITDPCLGEILQMTTSGSVRAYFSPSGDQPSSGGGITLGPDGNVWYVEYSNVASISPSGTIAEYVYTDGNSGNAGGIATGADGNLWVAEAAAEKLDVVNPSTGAMTSDIIHQLCQPSGVAEGTDGNIYTACGQFLVRFTTAGAELDISNSSGANGAPDDIAPGPGGIWFASNASGGLIGQLNTSTDAIATFPSPGAGYDPNGLAAGPDGNVWMTTSSGNIDVYVLNPLDVDPGSLTLASPGQMGTLTVTESGTVKWTAKSSNAAIATVAQGMAADLFVVTGVAAGKCSVTIADKAGNLFKVGVTVK